MMLFRKYWGLVLVILVSLIPLAAFAQPGLPITHDGQDHVARIANFYQSLSEGVIVPRWAGNLNWGYGHPILMFLYPLSSYTASMFHFYGFSFVESTKLVFGFAFLLSGAAMYLWLREFLGKEAAIVGAIIYNFAPYRFVDLYVRGAIGEHVAFIFPPLILYFLLQISNSMKFNRFYFCGAALSFAGLILAHNAISIMFIPLIFLYAAYLIWESINRKSLMYQFAAAITLGVTLSAFFLFPAFLEGKYTLRDIVTEGVTTSRFVNYLNLVYSPWNYGQSGEFSTQVGILSWIGTLAGIFSIALYRRQTKKQIVIAIIFLYFLLSLILMIPISLPVWESFSILQKFQFPWRFLTVSVFSAAVLGAFAVGIIKSTKTRTIIAFIVIIAALATTYTYWQPKDYQKKSEKFYSGIYFGTTDTGESAPIWSVRFMEKTAKAPYEVLRGEAKIKPVSRTSTRHVFDVDAKYRSQIRENTLYFPGWKIFIDGKTYSGIQFQDPASRGLMTFYVPSGKHRVEAVFTETRVRAISNYISMASFIIIIGIALSTFAPVKHNKK